MPEPDAPAVPFLDVAGDSRRVSDEVLRRFERIIDRGVFVHGEETAALESAATVLTGADYAIACSSGSDALYLALRALGIGRGDAVLVPAFTFIATAGAIARVGARPVFTDIDADSFNVGAADVVAATEREFARRDGRLVHRDDGAVLRALIVVHLFGQPADMQAIEQVTTEAGIAIVEDGAHALAARGNGGPVGSWGRLGCFSFYPTKNLGGAGDGGLLTTSDVDLVTRVGALRVHGVGTGSGGHDPWAVNARIGELQAAFLNAKLPHLPSYTRARGEIAGAYRQRLAALAGRELIVLPQDLTPPEHVWHQYTVRVTGGRRDALHAELAAAGIATRVFYPTPLHLEPCFADHGYRAGDLPNAERVCGEVLSLPIYPSLDHDGLGLVADRMAASLGG